MLATTKVKPDMAAMAEKNTSRSSVSLEKKSHRSIPVLSKWQGHGRQVL
jgi:hypothetical protein